MKNYIGLTWCCAIAVVLLASHQTTSAQIGDLTEHHRMYNRRVQVSICFLESFGNHGRLQGTGFLGLSYVPGIDVLFTAKHVVEGQDSIRGMIFCSADDYKTVLSIPIRKILYPNGKRDFFVPDTLQDGVAILLNISENKGVIPKGSKVRVIPRSSYVETHDVFVGIPVVVAGYPMGMKSEDGLPIVRRGFIAGLNSETNEIILELDAYGGTSGAAVFVDETHPVGQSFVSTYNASFLGLVWGYVPFRKQYVNPIDRYDALQLSENSGLAKVVPADILARFPDLLKRLVEEQGKK